MITTDTGEAYENEFHHAIDSPLPAPTDKLDFTNKYNSPGGSPGNESYDYDMQGYVNSGGETKGEGIHYPDTYKKPNHPTFSTESQYHDPASGLEGGQWEKQEDGSFNFYPGKTNLQMHGAQGLQDYFDRVEKGNHLMLPYKMNMNDNAPKIDPTLPNLSGGLKSPPKPANDNDPRKPFGAASNKEDPAFDVIQNYIQMQKNIDTWAGPDDQKIPVYDWAARGVLPKSTDLSDISPSTNIIKGKDGPPMSEEARDTLTKQYYSNDPGKDTLGIGLSDVQDRIDEGVIRTTQRDAAALEHFQKAWKQIIPTQDPIEMTRPVKKKTSQK